jgi:hypothetical protein
MGGEPRRTAVDKWKKLNELKVFRIPSRVANDSSPIGWTLVKVNISGVQRLRASEPTAH